MRDFYNPCITLQTFEKAKGHFPLTVFNVSAGRGPGKTFGWTELITDWVFQTPTIKGWEDYERILWDKFFAEGDKFILMTRKRESLGHVFDGVFKKMLSVKYPHITKFYEAPGLKGVYTRCIMEYLEDDTDEDGQAKRVAVKKHVGYVVSVKSDDDIKNVSSMFTDAGVFFTDEFQPGNDDTYVPHEVRRFKRIYKSVARGGDAETDADGNVNTAQSVRRVPMIFVSNAISIENPYFVSAKIWNKIQSNTMKYMTDEVIYHRVENEEINEEYKKGIDSIFADEDEGVDNAWINDDYSCVEPNMKGYGDSDYQYTLISGNSRYGVRYYPECGLYYIDTNYDKHFSLKMNLYTQDMQPNIPAFKSSMRMKRLTKAMKDGRVRFKNTMIKNECKVLLLGGTK